MIKNIKLVVTIKELREILNHNFKDLDHRKIEKVEGLGLSTNDFSDAYKLKLDNIESGAQANDIESISVDGKVLEIKNKQVEIHQPVYSLVENPQPSENNFKEYNLTIDGEVTGLTIEVPKDIFLDKCTLEKVTVENEPYEGSKIGDAYLQLELNDGTIIYTPVTELQYHAGQDIVIDENNINKFCMLMDELEEGYYFYKQYRNVSYRIRSVKEAGASGNIYFCSQEIKKTMQDRILPYL